MNALMVSHWFLCQASWRMLHVKSSIYKKFPFNFCLLPLQGMKTGVFVIHLNWFSTFNLVVIFWASILMFCSPSLYTVISTLKPCFYHWMAIWWKKLCQKHYNFHRTQWKPCAVLLVILLRWSYWHWQVIAKRNYLNKCKPVSGIETFLKSLFIKSSYNDYNFYAYIRKEEIY